MVDLELLSCFLCLQPVGTGDKETTQTLISTLDSNSASQHSPLLRRPTVRHTTAIQSAYLDRKLCSLLLILVCRRVAIWKVGCVYVKSYVKIVRLSRVRTEK